MEVPTYPDLPYANRSDTVRFRTEAAQFDTGYQVRSGRWSRSLRAFTLSYELLTETWWQSILDLFERQRGGLSYFRFDDYVDTTPTNRQFGVGDGSTTVFKLPHDYTSGAIIYVDGAAYSNVYVDPETGRVEFDTAPALGAELTYSCSEAGFRVRFAGDELQFNRLMWGGYAGTVQLEQVADQQDVYPIRQVVHGGTLTSMTLDASGEAIGFSFVAPVAVTAATLHYYMSAQVQPATPPAQAVRVSLYSNSSGAPGTLLASGTHTPGTLGWQTVTLTAPYALTKGTRYWVVIDAYSGDWSGSHSITVRYTNGLTNPIPGEDQDDMLWGGYVLQDRRCQNTPNSWLGVALKTGGTWAARDANAHPAFFINTTGTIVGHVQAPFSQAVYDTTRVRESFPVETINDIVIDRIGAIVSTNGAPAASLSYAIVFASDPATVQRSGVLATTFDTAGVPTYVEAILSQPLTISPDTPLTTPTGEMVNIAFYSAGSVVGAPWTLHGHFDTWDSYSTGWEANWNSVRWAEDESRAKISTDGGLTYPTEVMGAFAVRCRGKMKP